MQLLLHLVALSGAVSLALANDQSPNRQLLSRQSVDCLPIFIENPVESDVQCGGANTYITPLCTCCPGGASGFIGCYTASDVCSADAYGNAICCPQDDAECGINGTAAMTADPSLASSSSSPSATADQEPDSGSAATATQVGLGSAATSTQPYLVSTTSASLYNPGSSAATSSVVSFNHTGGSTSKMVEWKSLLMMLLLGLI